MKKILPLLLLLPFNAFAQYSDAEERYASGQLHILEFIDRHPIISLLILIVLFIIKVLIIRAIFSIPKIVHHLQAQNKLLALIAEKQGVERKAIDKATRKEDNSSNPFVIDK
jgi:hypothetical protein